ncbi:MAG: asparagine synthase (glutamine-hydrolyzing) [Alphaproteobacteria bacterium]
MCGIAGVVKFGDLDRADVAPRLASAIDRLRPRGPDGEGTWFDDRCALGHTRLAIVDPTPDAAQPMARDGLVVVYNGEIHNHAALRDELRALGHDFTTRSDTEVLLAGWRQWGAEMLPRLRGMFAFALWDSRRARLVLARDRFGEKPLLYASDPGGVAFASDLVALSRLRGTAGTLDLDSLRLYFALKYVPEPRAILEGVAKVPPGHWLAIDAAGDRLTRWYALAPADADADLVARFDAAVADRLVADAPVGAYLSGGVDSGLVVASMARQATEVRTFTVGFAGAPAYYEERPAARALASRLGTRHEEIEVDAATARMALDAVFDAYDEPFADASAVPSWLLARAVRGSVAVALSGDGGDELFAGYRRHLGERYAETYGRLPHWLRQGLIERLARRWPEGKETSPRRAARRLRRFVAHTGADPLARHVGWVRIMDDAEVADLVAPPGAAPDVAALYRDARARGGADPINAVLAGDLLVGLPGDMLAKVDRASMAHGLEARCPFLDHRVVEAAFALPGAAKLGWRSGKLALRRAFADRLPAEHFDRPKRGFELPIASWLGGPLADRVARALDPALIARQGLLRPELPRRWRTELASGRRDTAERLWAVVAFEAWAERNGFS